MKKEKVLQLEPIHGMDRFRVYLSLKYNIYNKHGHLISQTEIARTAFARVCALLDDGYYNLDALDLKQI